MTETTNLDAGNTSRNANKPAWEPAEMGGAIVLFDEQCRKKERRSG
jgi:hypothetical protein